MRFFEYARAAPLFVLKSMMVMLLAWTAALAAGEERLLCDFETDAEKLLFEMKTGVLSDQHATRGHHSLKILPGEYLSSWRLPRDWSPFESLELDAFVEGDEPIAGTILVADQAWKDRGSSYWNRANRTFTLKPGANVIALPVQGLYRGEAGSRGNDLTSAIDAKDIIRLDFGFDKNEHVKAIYLDALRLTRSGRPEGILAFDFGPGNQSLFPGFTAISWNTVYHDHGLTAGLRARYSGANRARDDTYPTRLFQDYVWFEEDGNEFLVDVPRGRCHVWMVFDDCGYWGGEQAQFRKRSILANGKQVFVDERGEGGPADYLFRFEDIEPRPGDSMWDLYVRELFKPARFEVEVGDGPLRIRCEADGTWSTKLAAMIVYPDSVAPQAERYIAQVLAANRAEFDARAVFLGPRPKALAIPPGAQAAGYWLGAPAPDDTVTFCDAPGAPATALSAVAALGEQADCTFAIRPLRDLPGPVALSVSDLSGPSGTIPASIIDLRYVHHLTHRESSDLAYTIMPTSLRHLGSARLALEKDLTRQFWISLVVPDDAKPGTYAGEVRLTAGQLAITLPLSLEVLPTRLDQPDVNIGFLGAWLPGALPQARLRDGWFELASQLRRMVANSFCGGPNIACTGFDAAGKPTLDFAPCDELFAALKRAGFTRPVYSYGGPAMVEGFGDAAGCREWARRSGMGVETVLRSVWSAVAEHAAKQGWPSVYLGMLDEPRTVAQARASLDLHALYRSAVPFVRDGGFYSVNWSGAEPLDATAQQLFATMYWSGLNEHAQIDLDKAKAGQREVHIYNQGLERHIFGEYLWSEMRKGVKGLMQWHVLALSGYQFYDLDGREPDPGVLNWGRREIIPTIYAYRCAAGIADLRYAATVWNLAQRTPGTPAAQAAIGFLDGVAARTPAGQRARVDGVPSDADFRAICIRHLKALLNR